MSKAEKKIEEAIAHLTTAGKEIEEALSIITKGEVLLSVSEVTGDTGAMFANTILHAQIEKDLEIIMASLKASKTNMYLLDL